MATYTKSVKFDHYEEQPLPSGKTLLNCVFKDNWGNTYKWTPRWKDMEEIFVKSMEIEGRNESEGIWDEELKRLAEKIPYRQHDVDIFEKSDAIMNEQEVLAYLYSLEAGHSFWDSQFLKVGKFLCFFNYESNRYVSKKLYGLAEKVCNTFNQLGEFLCGKVYDVAVPPDAPDTKMGLYPYFDIVVRNGQDQEKWRQQYDNYVAELHKLVGAARQAYKHYHVHIREILFR